MKTVLIEAEFVGQNGYLGFKTGKKYVLSVGSKEDGTIYIEHKTAQYCLYDNLVKFFDNWNRIKTIHQ